MLTLLAVAAAYPRVADRLLVALQDGVGRKGIGSWQEFITALDPGGAGGLPGALVPADLTGQSLSAIAKADAASWANLHQALEACAPHNTLTIMEPYQRWGSVAARFSFTLCLAGHCHSGVLASSAVCSASVINTLCCPSVTVACASAAACVAVSVSAIRTPAAVTR